MQDPRYSQNYSLTQAKQSPATMIPPKILLLLFHKLHWKAEGNP